MDNSDKIFLWPLPHFSEARLNKTKIRLDIPVLDIIVTVVQNSRMVQRINRCPRTFFLVNFAIDSKGIMMKKSTKSVLNKFITVKTRWAITAAPRSTEISKDSTRSKPIDTEFSKWTELANKIQASELNRANKMPFNLFEKTCCSHFYKPFTRHKNMVPDTNGIIVFDADGTIVSDANGSIKFDSRSIIVVDPIDHRIIIVFDSNGSIISDINGIIIFNITDNNVSDSIGIFVFNTNGIIVFGSDGIIEFDSSGIIVVDPIDLTDYKTYSGYLIFGTYLELHMHSNFFQAAVDKYELLPGLERPNGPTSAYLILITAKDLVTTPWIINRLFLKHKSFARNYLEIAVCNCIEFTSKLELGLMYRRKRIIFIFDTNGIIVYDSKGIILALSTIFAVIQGVCRSKGDSIIIITKDPDTTLQIIIAFESNGSTISDTNGIIVLDSNGIFIFDISGIIIVSDSNDIIEFDSNGIFIFDANGIIVFDCESVITITKDIFIDYVNTYNFKANSRFDSWYYKDAYVKSSIGFKVCDCIELTSKPGLVTMYVRKTKCCLFVCLEQGQHISVCQTSLANNNHG